MNTPGAKSYRPWTPELYAQQAHAPAAKLPDDDLVFLKKKRQDKMADTNELVGQPLWVSAGGQMEYYPAAGKHIDFSKTAGTLLGFFVSRRFGAWTGRGGRGVRAFFAKAVLMVARVSALLVGWLFRSRSSILRFPHSRRAKRWDSWTGCSDVARRPRAR